MRFHCIVPERTTYACLVERQLAPSRSCHWRHHANRAAGKGRNKHTINAMYVILCMKLTINKAHIWVEFHVDAKNVNSRSTYRKFLRKWKYYVPYIWTWMHDGAVVIRQIQCVEIVGRVSSKVEQIRRLDVLALDVDVLVAIRSVHFVQQPESWGDSVDDGLPLQMNNFL